MAKMTEIEDDGIQLPFSHIKQSAFLGHLIVNEKFYKMCAPRIKPQWFLLERHRQIYELLIDFIKTYKIFPRGHEFSNCPKLMLMEPSERSRIQAVINQSIMETSQVRLEAIKPELTEWLHTNILMQAMHAASDSFNAKDVKATHTKLMAAVKEVSETSFEQGDEITFANFDEYLAETQKERKKALTTGLKMLDKAMLEGNAEGALLYGDTTIVMSPVNVGKTSFLVTTMCHNILRGKDVLFMTHEGSPAEIRLKILSNMLKMPGSRILDCYKTEEGERRLRSVTQMLEKHLKYIPYNKAGGMFIERVTPIIRSTQEEWISSHNGKGFDLLVSDYPAILSTEMAMKGNLAKREQDRIVYDTYVQLALEYKFHALLAIQTNREGSKINKGLTGEGRALEMEDVKESWDPMAEASNVLTLNRPPWAEQKNILMINLAKTRSNARGIVVIAKTNYSCSLTHSDELGGIIDKGGHGDFEEIANGLLERYVESKHEVPKAPKPEITKEEL
jgi:replicative DNA helicase